MKPTVSLVSRPRSTTNQLALGLADFNVLHNRVELDLVNLRSKRRRSVKLVRGFDLVGELLELGEELVGDGVLDVDAGAGGADLAHVAVDTVVAPL